MDRVRAASTTRRTLLAAGAAAPILTGAGGALLAACKPAPKGTAAAGGPVGKGPRRVAPSRKRIFVQTKLTEGWYLNPKSHLAHYVDAQGRMVGVASAAAIGRYTPVTLGNGVRIAGEDASYAAEHVALAAFGTGGKVTPNADQLHRAQSALQAGIASFQAGKSRTRPLRLYDFAAGLAARYDDRESLRQLVVLANAAPAHPDLAARIALWSGHLGEAAPPAAQGAVGPVPPAPPLGSPSKRHPQRQARGPSLKPSLKRWLDARHAPAWTIQARAFAATPQPRKHVKGQHPPKMFFEKA